MPLQHLARVNSLILQNRVLVSEMMATSAKLSQLDPRLHVNIDQVSAAWANRGGAAISELVSSMHALSASSSKIAEIFGVIV